MAIKDFKGFKKDEDTYKCRDDRADNLGTASTKNSTSVVTDSSDLVESGAVYDAIKGVEQELVETVGFGAWNQLRINHTEINPFVFRGITYSQQSDNSFILSGTCDNTGNSYMQICKNIPIKAGRYKLFVSNTQSTDVWIDFTFAIKGNIRCVSGNVVEVDLTSNDLFNVYINVKPDATVMNLLVQPMIYDASLINPSYVPYHQSVENILTTKTDNSVIAPIENGTNASQAYAVGQHFIKDGQFKEVTQPISSGGAINDSNTVDKPIAELLATISLNLSNHTDVTILQNESKKVGNVVLFRVQFQVTNDIADRTDIFTCSSIAHPQYGACEALNSNTGDTIPILVGSSFVSVPFNCRAAIPTGYYVLNYTFII